MKTRQTQKLLKLLNSNPCCDCPPLSDVAGNIIICNEDGLYASAPEPGESLLFAVAGQDDIAAQNRSFDITGFDFEISSGVGDDTLLGVYEGVNFKQILAQVTSPLADNGMAYIDIINQDTPGSNSYVDIYAQNGNGESVQWYVAVGGIYGYVSPGGGDLLIEGGNDGNSGTYIQMTPTTPVSSSTIYLQASNTAAGNNLGVYLDMSSNNATSSYIDIYAYGVGGGSDDTEFYMEAGQIYIFLDTNADLILDGIDQDDTATQVLVKNGSDAVRWREASTIGGVPGAAAVFIDYDTIICPDDASPVQGFSLALEANALYSIEAYFTVTHSSGVGYNITMGTLNPFTSMNNIIEFMSPASGGEIDTINIKREYVIGANTFNLPNASFNSPTGSPVLRMTGFIENAGAVNDLFISAALDSAGPQSGGLVGWIKLTKI